MEQLSIVYVEDSFADAELFKRAFLQMLPSSALHHFRDAETAQQFFLEAVQTDRSIDLAVIDIRLPGMSGDELIRWIRQQSKFIRLPIIALSSGPAFETVEAAQSIGATSFFIKPVGHNDCIDLVYHIHDFCTGRVS